MVGSFYNESYARPKYEMNFAAMEIFNYIESKIDFFWLDSDHFEHSSKRSYWYVVKSAWLGSAKKGTILPPPPKTNMEPKNHPFAEPPLAYDFSEQNQNPRASTGSLFFQSLRIRKYCSKNKSHQEKLIRFYSTTLVVTLTPKKLKPVATWGFLMAHWDFYFPNIGLATVSIIHTYLVEAEKVVDAAGIPCDFHHGEWTKKSTFFWMIFDPAKRLVYFFRAQN